MALERGRTAVFLWYGITPAWYRPKLSLPPWAPRQVLKGILECKSRQLGSRQPSLNFRLEVRLAAEALCLEPQPHFTALHHPLPYLQRPPP